MTNRRPFGKVRRLPSKRWQARYKGSDGVERPAPLTFDTKAQADAWLSVTHTAILRKTWRPPEAGAFTLREYAEAVIAMQTLKPRTREDYGWLLRDHILPTLGDWPIGDITPAQVRTWHASLAKTTGPARQSNAYTLLHGIMATAVSEDMIDANPCRIKGAGAKRRKSTTNPATLAELKAIVDALPSDNYRLMVLLAAWCGLRFGELTELRRRDIDLDTGRLTVARGVVRVGGAYVVGDPKSEAGKRTMGIPQNVLPLVAEYVADLLPGALLFPNRTGGHLAPSTLFRVYYPARELAGRPDLRFHDLRHTGATLYAIAGATPKETMARLGHSTQSAWWMYQHATEDRDAALTTALGDMATDATVTPLRGAQGS